MRALRGCQSVSHLVSCDVWDDDLHVRQQATISASTHRPQPSAHLTNLVAGLLEIFARGGGSREGIIFGGPALLLNPSSRGEALFAFVAAVASSGGEPFDLLCPGAVAAAGGLSTAAVAGLRAGDWRLREVATLAENLHNVHLSPF